MVNNLKNDLLGGTSSFVSNGNEFVSNADIFTSGAGWYSSDLISSVSGEDTKVDEEAGVDCSSSSTSAMNSSAEPLFSRIIEDGLDTKIILRLLSGKSSSGEIGSEQVLGEEVGGGSSLNSHE